MKKNYLIICLLAFISCKKKDEIKPLPLQILNISFQPSVNSVFIGDSVVFNNTSTSNLKNIEYYWTFNGGSPRISTLKNPTVKYPNSGKFDVKLVVKGEGKIDSITVKSVIEAKTGLLAYYPFTGDAKDMSGNGHHGTPNNTVLTTDRFNQPNSAYYFNGINSFISVNDHVDLRLAKGDFTINGWVLLERYDPSFGSTFLIKRGSGSANGWGTSITGYGSLNTPTNKLGGVFFNVSGGTDPFAVGQKTIELNKWVMITFSYDSSKKRVSLYLNGDLDSVTSNIPSPNQNTNAKLIIGSDNDRNVTGSTGYFIKGKIDDIGFYERKLSDVEVKNIYLGSSSIPLFD